MGGGLGGSLEETGEEAEEIKKSMFLPMASFLRAVERGGGGGEEGAEEVGRFLRRRYEKIFRVRDEEGRRGERRRGEEEMSQREVRRKREKERVAEEEEMDYFLAILPGT